MIVAVFGRMTVTDDEIMPSEIQQVDGSSRIVETVDKKISMIFKPNATSCKIKVVETALLTSGFPSTWLNTKMLIVLIYL